MLAIHRMAVKSEPGSRRIGELRIGRRLGAGGMGIVYEGVRPDGQIVAIKVLLESSDDRARTRFLDEAIAGSIVHHPNVVRMLEHGETDDGAAYLVMDRVYGERASHLIRHCELTVAAAIDLACQLLRGLHALHEAGIVHGDVKSENILVEKRSDGTRKLVLVDLGLARVWFDGSDAQKLEMVSGTPDYMAPEVVQGCGISPASDIYAASILLYEMLTGTTPFRGGSATDILKRHLDEIAVPPSLRAPEADISSALDRAVLRGLAKRPADRHATAAAFADELGRLVDVSRTTTRIKTLPDSTEARTVAIEPGIRGR